jgi:hypothetical protein
VPQDERENSGRIGLIHMERRVLCRTGAGSKKRVGFRDSEPAVGSKYGPNL